MLRCTDKVCSSPLLLPCSPPPHPCAAATATAQVPICLIQPVVPLIVCTGATYDSIEGRFRIIKREAAVLKAEIDSGVRAPAPPRGGPTAGTASTSFASNASTSSQPSTPKKPKTPATKKKDGVIAGRVGKNGTPTKKTNGVKKEAGGETLTMIKDEEPIIMGQDWVNEELEWGNEGIMEA